MVATHLFTSKLQPRYVTNVKGKTKVNVVLISFVGCFSITNNIRFVIIYLAQWMRDPTMSNAKARILLSPLLEFSMH